MRILVTGGTGFVVRHIVNRLVKEGHEVTITSGGHLPAPEGVRVLYRGLQGINWEKIRGMDVVFHQSANNDTRCSDKDEMIWVNGYGPQKMFYYAVQGGCKNFIYASSTAVYGAEPAPYTEDTPVKPLNAYGESKAWFDNFAMKFAEEFNAKVVGLRYCNVYGEGEGHKGSRMSMIGQMIRSMMKGQKPRLFESGEQRRDWIYVDDVVELNMLAMLSKESGIYNCGSGVSSTFNEIVKVINELIFLKGKFPVSAEYIPCSFEAEYQSHTECCMEKARTQLGFRPYYDLKTGIAKYLNAFSCEPS